MACEPDYAAGAVRTASPSSSPSCSCARVLVCSCARVLRRLPLRRSVARPPVRGGPTRPLATHAAASSTCRGWMNRRRPLMCRCGTGTTISRRMPLRCIRCLSRSSTRSGCCTPPARPAFRRALCTGQVQGVVLENHKTLRLHLDLTPATSWMMWNFVVRAGRLCVDHHVRRQPGAPAYRSALAGLRRPRRHRLWGQPRLSPGQ